MECNLCDRALDSGTVCPSCMGRATSALRELPLLVPELATTLAKLSRSGPRPDGRSSGDQPLPINTGALEASHGLYAVLVHWARFATRWANTAPDTGNVLALALWLQGHTEPIRQADEAHEYVTEVTMAVSKVRRVVDNPAERWYAGPCDGCGQDLYGRSGAQWVTCGCGATYDVKARRDWLLDQVADRLATPREISRALGTLAGVEVTTSVIRGLAKRKRIQLYEGGRYRVGDVLDRILERTSQGSRS